MYGKTGRIDVAKKAFEEMPIRDLGSWNSIIAAYGINVNGTLAVQLFMELTKLATRKPNVIPCVLSACAYTGSGRLEEAKVFIAEMPNSEHRHMHNPIGCLWGFEECRWEDTVTESKNEKPRTPEEGCWLELCRGQRQTVHVFRV
ncbi:Pentatricopeptide repeat [Dillenia turbinata]|uniref:Pentatricopeptide repeat n=1 Tax=Dillenia turbinata TaxID=194707 RepID=A0AAN8WDJ0_9MAGN